MFFIGEGQMASSYGSGRLNAELLDAAVARCQAQANQEVEDKAGTTQFTSFKFLMCFQGSSVNPKNLSFVFIISYLELDAAIARFQARVNPEVEDNAGTFLYSRSLT